jgi:hypothetical protein
MVEVTDSLYRTMVSIYRNHKYNYWTERKDGLVTQGNGISYFSYCNKDLDRPIYFKCKSKEEAEWAYRNLEAHGINWLKTYKRQCKLEGISD